MPALVKYTLYIIVSSILFTNSSSAATKLGAAIEDILHVRYVPFATEKETKNKQGVSCISTIIYGIQALGFQCMYHDFKVYQSSFNKTAKPLVLGVTKFDSDGLVLFSRAHFAALYKDANNNNVIDEKDLIIHALFHPVKITTLKEWLDKDFIKPIKFVKLNSTLECPSTYKSEIKGDEGNIF